MLGLNIVKGMIVDKYYAVVYKGLFGQPVVCNLSNGGMYEDHNVTTDIRIAKQCREHLVEKNKHVHVDYRPEYRVVEMIVKEME